MRHNSAYGKLGSLTLVLVISLFGRTLLTFLNLLSRLLQIVESTRVSRRGEVEDTSADDLEDCAWTG